MPEFHYPGYNYLGPGTDLRVYRRPINKLDASARKHDLHYDRYDKAGIHDYYWKSSKADNNFIKATDDDYSIPGRISNYAFRAKRFLTKVLNIPDITEPKFKKRKMQAMEISQSSGLRETAWQMQGGKRKRRRMSKFRRRLKRIKRRRSMRFYKRVLSIINPPYTFSQNHLMRYVGMLNQINYMHLTQHTILAGYPLYSPGAFVPITDAITNALGISTRATYANWSKDECYYIKQKWHWRISNNSLAPVRAEVYWITPGIMQVENTAYVPRDWIQNAAFSNTNIYPNNVSQPICSISTTLTNTSNFISPLNYHLFKDPNLRKFLGTRLRITKGDTLFFRPGETLSLKYRKKYHKFTVNDLFNSSGTKMDYPKTTVWPMIVWRGDLVPGSTTSAAGVYSEIQSGTTPGDFSVEQLSWFKVIQKYNQDTRIYLTQQNEIALREDTKSQLTIKGEDNQTANIEQG